VNAKTHRIVNPILAPHSADPWMILHPVFKKTEQVWGVGHCSFVKSLCQNEDWIIYHSKSSPRPGWEDRDVHAKPFAWSSDGFPDFGVRCHERNRSRSAKSLDPGAFLFPLKVPLPSGHSGERRLRQGRFEYGLRPVQ
jgi:hypothetical protein